MSDTAPGALCQNGRKGTIRTYTGRYVDPLNLDPSLVSIQDIAHHLACLNRYTGAVPEPYSVAQHCVIASHYFVQPRLALAMLLHDAPEYVLNDLATPLKNREEMKAYRDADDRALEVVLTLFGLGDLAVEMNAGGRLKRVDEEMYWRERASFDRQISKYDPKFIKPVPWNVAKRQYLARFFELHKKVYP